MKNPLSTQIKLKYEKNFFTKNLYGIKKFFSDFRFFKKDLRFYENPLSTQI